MHLTKRLMAVASLVESKSIIDIGCDHALLDIYLAEQGVNCLAIDQSEKCIDLARKNIEKSGLSHQITVLKNDGLKGIELNGESLIIAGMGTTNILKILSRPLDNDLIILTNNDLTILRKKIIDKGYYIDLEKVVFDKGRYYVVIRFKKGYKKYHKNDYFKGFVTDKDYYYFCLTKENKRYSKIPKKCIFKKIQSKKRIRLIKERLKTIV